METKARRGVSDTPANVNEDGLSGSANWIITNFSVGVAYSESVITVAAASISAPVNGSSGYRVVLSIASVLGTVLSIVIWPHPSTRVPPDVRLHLPDSAWPLT